MELIEHAAKPNGIKIAIATTIAIAKHLPNRQDKKLFKKVVQSIFDDQLRLNTDMPREERRRMLTRINKILKKELQ